MLWHFWDEMAFLASWLPPFEATVVCFNTPQSFQEELRNMLWGDEIRCRETQCSHKIPSLSSAPNAGQLHALSLGLPHSAQGARHRLDPRDPYALLSIILGQVLALYDKSIWAICRLVRGFERVWSPSLLQIILYSVALLLYCPFTAHDVTDAKLVGSWLMCGSVNVGGHKLRNSARS
jgi:hypothetical protein